MSGVRIFIVGMGILGPLGRGVERTREALRDGRIGIRPLHLFASPHTGALPVGEVQEPLPVDDPPRTHALALAAAEEALAGSGEPPDAVVMGVTTGGMLRTEELLKEGRRDARAFQCHSTGSVAEMTARKHGCTGPALTISTACSSGAAAIGIALEMLRSGQARRVLAGGADALCRLTFHGFNSLQLIDPDGARPLDRDRRGMCVGEGAAMLLLAASEKPPFEAAVELIGAGFSCDAHHPATPRPDGAGAAEAIRAALDDGKLSAGAIDYINLHGTGTIDNDLAEARAVKAVFGDRTPPLSSVKGAMGHSLAAAGAMEAVIAAMAVSDGRIPGNAGCRIPDPELALDPVMTSEKRPVRAVLSNSFGFGGNNVSLVIGASNPNRPSPPPRGLPAMFVMGSALFAGAGDADALFAALARGEDPGGIRSLAELSRGLPPRAIRRLKRLPRMALSLAGAAREDAGAAASPGAVFFGTGWGALSETHDFLDKLFDSRERFTSPIDFIGSVHNAPAGQIAIHHEAKGPNITTCGGDHAFEQALLSASLLGSRVDSPVMLLGADEHHETFTPLFDPSVQAGTTPSDGGGALCLSMVPDAPGPTISLACFKAFDEGSSAAASLVRALGGARAIRDRFGALLAGLPAAHRPEGQKLLDEFLALAGFSGPVIDYRKIIGEFASASAVGVVLAERFTRAGVVPKGVHGPESLTLSGKGVLHLGLGRFITAVEVIGEGRWGVNR